MRNRYVSQVLLATLGFGMLLAVIAVIQTPADRSPQKSDTPSKTADSPPCHAGVPPAHTPNTTPRTDDFNDECEFLPD